MEEKHEMEKMKRNEKENLELKKMHKREKKSREEKLEIFPKRIFEVKKII